MAYDLLILDDSGFPLYVVSLDINTHHKVIDLAKNKELSLISKISDYYEDSIYSIYYRDKSYANTFPN